MAFHWAKRLIGNILLCRDVWTRHVLWAIFKFKGSPRILQTLVLKTLIFFLSMTRVCVRAIAHTGVGDSAAMLLRKTHVTHLRPNRGETPVRQRVWANTGGRLHGLAHVYSAGNYYNMFGGGAEEGFRAFSNLKQDERRSYIGVLVLPTLPGLRTLCPNIFIFYFLLYIHCFLLWYSFIYFIYIVFCCDIVVCIVYTLFSVGVLLYVLYIHCFSLIQYNFVHVMISTYHRSKSSLTGSVHSSCMPKVPEVKMKTLACTLTGVATYRISAWRLEPSLGVSLPRSSKAP